MDTERLIRRLSEDLQPVAPLNRPWRRTACWAGIGAIYLVLLALLVPARWELLPRVSEVPFLFQQGAALTAVLVAAAAAFATSVPGGRHGLVWLALAAAAVWVAAIGTGAVRDLRAAGSFDAVFRTDWPCVGAVLAGAAVPAGAMFAMLRSGAPLTPHATAALGGLAAAGLGNVGVCLVVPHDSDVVVLIWHCGTVLAASALAGFGGRRLLPWPTAPPVSPGGP